MRSNDVLFTVCIKLLLKCCTVSGQVRLGQYWHLYILCMLMQEHVRQCGSHLLNAIRASMNDSHSLWGGTLSRRLLQCCQFKWQIGLGIVMLLWFILVPGSPDLIDVMLKWCRNILRDLIRMIPYRLRGNLGRCLYALHVCNGADWRGSSWSTLAFPLCRALGT
eukprot:jgi/Botrbrau1/12212/Bobra.0197s0006.1